MTILRTVGRTVGTYILPLLALSPAAFADRWDVYNDPALLVPGYNPHIAAVPLKSQLPDAKIPWDETYWPTIKGGIAFRWNATDPQILKYHSPSLQTLRGWSESQLAALSPAEKYDIFVGDYTYPTVRDQFGRKGFFTGTWSGICDGWSASALSYSNEPKQITLVNRDGIAVPFGSSDIKALLSFNYAIREWRPSVRVGTECTKSKSFGSSFCQDVNAGSFHIILTNKIGLRQEGFVAEIDPGHEVWNQPIYQYSFTVLQSGLSPRRKAAGSTVSESLIKMDMTYPQDDETDDHVKTVSHMYPTKGTSDYRKTTSTYYYYLELNASGDIVGGEWTTADQRTGFADHPDFLWAPNAVEFRGYYSAIGDIYRQSIQTPAINATPAQ